MKKSLKFLSLLLMVMLVLTGCKKEDPKKQLENALEKLEKAESVSLKLDADLSIISKTPLFPPQFFLKHSLFQFLKTNVLSPQHEFLASSKQISGDRNVY